MKSESSAPTFAGFLAIDWADKEHVYALSTPSQPNPVLGKVPHTQEGIASLITKLQEQFKGDPVAVILEQSEGSLIYALQEYPSLHIYPINPVQASKFREALHPSRAKSDPGDARMLLQYLISHRDNLRVMRPLDNESMLLRRLAEDRRQFVDQRTKFVQQIMAELKCYFPLILELFPDLTTTVAMDFLLKWPTLEALQAARKSDIRNFLYARNCRARIEERLELIFQVKPIVTNETIIETSSRKTSALARLIRQLTEYVTEYNEKLESNYKRTENSIIFDSFPGVGNALGPRLAGVFTQDRGRYASAEELQTFSGIAPITRSSGQSKNVVSRKSCPKYVKQTFHEFAKCSIQASLWAKAYYQSQKTKGKSHQAIVRSLAFKWIRIMWACWQNQKPYNELEYIECLQKNNVPWAKGLAAKS